MVSFGFLCHIPGGTVSNCQVIVLCSQEEEINMATQLQTRPNVMPITQVVRREKARAITDDEKKFKAFIVLRQARINKKLFGKREKKRRETEEKDK